MFWTYLLVFVSRILDVSLGTIRTIMTVRGRRVVAALFGFVEVMIWFLVVREALDTDLPPFFVAIAFAGGFATGTFIGGLVTNLMLPSDSIMQIITSKRDPELLKIISDAGYSMTVSDVYGRDHQAEKYMLFICIDGKYVSDLKDLIIKHDKSAFITISNNKAAINGSIVPVFKKK
jgi:uncharacterized protein YebE (UPF0316 family)